MDRVAAFSIVAVFGIIIMALVTLQIFNVMPKIPPLLFGFLLLIIEVVAIFSVLLFLANKIFHR